MPLVLLVVVLLEEVLTYKVRQHVRDVHLRVAIIIALNAFAFVLAGGWLAPWLRDLFTQVRKGSRKTAGDLGLLLFYLLAYGAIYYAYLVIERHGAGGLLPASLR
jgi:hypothetical protein